MIVFSKITGTYGHLRIILLAVFATLICIVSVRQENYSWLKSKVSGPHEILLSPSLHQFKCDLTLWIFHKLNLELQLCKVENTISQAYPKTSLGLHSCCPCSEPVGCLTGYSLGWPVGSSAGKTHTWGSTCSTDYRNTPTSVPEALCTWAHLATAMRQGFAPAGMTRFCRILMQRQEQSLFQSRHSWGFQAPRGQQSHCRQSWLPCRTSLSLLLLPGQPLCPPGIGNDGYTDQDNLSTALSYGFGHIESRLFHVQYIGLSKSGHLVRV